MERTAELRIPLDLETKTVAEQLFESFGITVADAVRMFLHQSIFTGGLPFELRQPRYNAETEAAIQETKDILSGKIEGKVYSSLEEFYRDLESEDDDA